MSIYKSLVDSHNSGDLDTFSKIAQTYFKIVADREVNDTRYMILKLEGKRKWRFAGFKKVRGVTVKCTLAKCEIKLQELI